MSRRTATRNFRVGGARLWLRLFWISSMVVLILTGTLAQHFTKSTELVRLRNALLLQPEPATHDWAPDTVPASFAVETAQPLPLFVDAVSRHALRVEGDDWATALKISRHLLVVDRNGSAIQSDLASTYQRIIEHGDGYCGDVVDVFIGLANAAGIFSRPWAFSFDGFGGHGHIFVEIWNRQSGRWIMVGLFNNFYAVDALGRPLSAMEFRDALLAGGVIPRIVPLDSAAPHGFNEPNKLIDYYRRGLPEWYMWWGSNVFEYDQAPLVRVLGGTHRALEQLGGIAAGVHPAIRILETPQNLPQRESMRWLRTRLIAVLAFGALALISLLGWVWARRARNAQSS